MLYRLISMVLGGLLWTSLSSAQVMPIPVDIQLALFSKALKYERHLSEKIGNDTLVVAIMYQKNFERSRKLKDDVEQVFKNQTTFGGFNFRYVTIDISQIINIKNTNNDEAARSPGVTRITDELVRNDVDLLYVAPVQEVDLDLISWISRNTGILTMTGIPHYVKAGLSVSLELHRSKPRFIFNLPAIRAEGSGFSAMLLRMSDVIY